MTEIKGRVAVVTGGASGIGKGIAKALASAGAKVAIADIIPDNARAAAAEINGLGGRALAVHCDVCDRASLKAMREEVTAGLGPATLLFANAGATSFDRLSAVTDENVDWIFQVNLLGVVNSVRTFLPDMFAAGSGHIVATASMAGLLPAWVPIHSTYASAKLGVIGLMLNAGLELAESDIFTTTYCPGGVSTNMKWGNSSYRPERFGGPTDEVVTLEPASAPAVEMRNLTPDQIAPMVLQAVERNRTFVFDHSYQRPYFQKYYADLVMQGYDDIEEYEKIHNLT